MPKKSVKKATTDTLERGNLYMGYSAQSKKLSSNGRGGVVCQFEGFTADGRVTVNTYYEGRNGSLSKHKINMSRLDERSDCFLLPLSDLVEAGAVEFHLNGKFKDLRPRTSPRIEALIEAGRTEFSVFNVMSADEASGAGATVGAHVLMGETDDGEFSNFNTGQVNQTKDLLAYLASEEEKRKRELEERRAQIAALKEGGVRLVRGKPENGELLKKLKPLREQLVNHSNHRNSATAFFGSVLKREDGELVWSESPDRGACHAGLRSFKGDDYVLSTVQKGILGDSNWSEQARVIDKGMRDVLIHFIDYLANRSPYAIAVETKDAEDIWEYGWVISTEHPSNLISSLCTATRHVWEYPARCYAFSKMVEGGVPEDIAFVACLAASGQPHKGSLNFNGNCVEHTALRFDRMTDLDIVSFACGNMPNANPNLKENGDYAHPNRVWSLFCPSSGGEFPDGSSTLIQGLQGMPKQESSKSSNPFETKKTGADKAINYAVRVAKQWIEDLGV